MYRVGERNKGTRMGQDGEGIRRQEGLEDRKVRGDRKVRVLWGQ